jgi:hypothetical protein
MQGAVDADRRDRHFAGQADSGITRLHARENDLPALGYVVSYRALQSALDMALARANMRIRHGMSATRVGGTPAYAAVECVGQRAADSGAARRCRRRDGRRNRRRAAATA